MSIALTQIIEQSLNAGYIFKRYSNKRARYVAFKGIANFLLIIIALSSISTSLVSLTNTISGFRYSDDKFNSILAELDAQLSFGLKNPYYLRPSSEPESDHLEAFRDSEDIIIDGNFFEWRFSDVLGIDSGEDVMLLDPSTPYLDILATYSRFRSQTGEIFFRVDFSEINKIDWGTNFVLILVKLDDIPERDENNALIRLISHLELDRAQYYSDFGIEYADSLIFLSNPDVNAPDFTGLKNIMIKTDGSITKIQKIAYSTLVGSIEFSVCYPAMKDRMISPKMNVFTCRKSMDVVVDENLADDLYFSKPGAGKLSIADVHLTFSTYSMRYPFASQSSVQKVKISFIQHGNQPYRATDWYGHPDWVQGIIYDPTGVVDHDNGIADGYHYSLKAHEDYRIPMDLELTASLLSALQYESPDFLDRIRQDIQDGVVDIVGTVYAQQKLPYYPEDMNEWAIATSKQMIREIVDPNSELDLPLNVMWVPDRTWTDIPNVVLPVSRHYRAIVLDDRPHFEDFGSSPDYHEPHRLTSEVSSYGNNLTVFFICTTFRDDIFQPSILRSHWAALAQKPEKNIVCLYGDDWEKSAGNGFFDNKDDYATMYRNSLMNIASTPWVEPTTLTKITKNITEGRWPLRYDIRVISDTAPYIDGNGYFAKADAFYYGLSGYNDEYNHYDYWYKVWKEWVPNNLNPYFSYTTKNLEQLWQDAYNALYKTSINNELIELGKHILAASQHETAFGAGELNWGNERLYDWQKRQSEHARYAMVFAYAANWANGVKNGTISNTSTTAVLDVDNDQAMEYVLLNRQILAIFDTVGGKLQWLFGYQNNVPLLLAGNSIVFFDGNDYHTGGIESGFGDYCDYGHQYPLSDSRVSKVLDTLPFDYDLNHVSQPRSQYDILRLDNFTYSLNFVSFSGGVKLNAVCSQTGHSKNITLRDNSTTLEIDYNTGSMPVYVFNGFSPNLLSLIYRGNNLNITQNNTSFMIENSEYPARVGLSWNNATVNASYRESMLFEERLEIYGTGIFSFNITAEPASPIRIHDIAFRKPEIGEGLNVSVKVYSLIQSSLDDVSIYYRVFNGSWSEFKNVSMNFVSGTTYRVELPSDASAVGNTIEFYIFANDTLNPSNYRVSRRYSVKVSDPLYRSIQVDGKNDFLATQLISIDPVGDSGDAQVDLVELYCSWDAELLYFGLNIYSSTNLMNWGGSNPTSIFLVIDSIKNAGYSNTSDTVHGDMWNRAIQFNGSQLPDFQLHATLNKDGPFIQYGIFNNASQIWSERNQTGVAYAYAPTTRGIFMEFSIEWQMVRKTGSILPNLAVSAGVCGGTDGDSAIDSVPHDPTTNALVGGSSEWVDKDTFNSDRFALIDWDKNNDSIPDFIPGIVEIVEPMNSSTQTGMVLLDISARASIIASFLNISINGTKIHSAVCKTNTQKLKYLFDSTQIPNGWYEFKIDFQLSDLSVISTSLRLYIFNLYETLIDTFHSLGSQIYIDEVDTWVVSIRVRDKFGEPVKNATIAAKLDLISYSNTTQSIYVSATDENGNCSIRIPIMEIGFYSLKIEVTHETILKNSTEIGIRVINKIEAPNYLSSSIAAGVVIVGFIILNGYWIREELKKGGNIR